MALLLCSSNRYPPLIYPTLLATAGVRFLCNIRFDPFKYIRTNRVKYSFVIMLPEIAKTIPDLFEHTVQYQRSNHLPHAHLDHFRNSKLQWNLCHYWRCV